MGDHPPPPEKLSLGDKVIVTNGNDTVSATINSVTNELFYDDITHPEGYYVYHLKPDTPKYFTSEKNHVLTINDIIGYSYNVKKKEDIVSGGGRRKTRKRKLKNRKSKRRRRASK